MVSSLKYASTPKNTRAELYKNKGLRVFYMFWCLKLSGSGVIRGSGRDSMEEKRASILSTEEISEQKQILQNNANSH